MTKFECCENDPDCDSPCAAHPDGGQWWGEEDRYRRGRGAIRTSRLLFGVGLIFGALAFMWPWL